MKMFIILKSMFMLWMPLLQWKVANAQEVEALTPDASGALCNGNDKDDVHDCIVNAIIAKLGESSNTPEPIKTAAGGIYSAFRQVSNNLQSAAAADDETPEIETPEIETPEIETPEIALLKAKYCAEIVDIVPTSMLDISLEFLEMVLDELSVDLLAESEKMVHAADKDDEDIVEFQDREDFFNMYCGITSLDFAVLYAGPRDALLQSLPLSDLNNPEDKIRTLVAYIDAVKKVKASPGGIIPEWKLCRSMGMSFDRDYYEAKEAVMSKLSLKCLRDGARGDDEEEIMADFVTCRGLEELDWTPYQAEREWYNKEQYESYFADKECTTELFDTRSPNIALALISALGKEPLEAAINEYM